MIRNIFRHDCPGADEGVTADGVATKNAVFQCHAFIDADVVLYFAFAADDGVGADDHVLADVAVFADFGTGEDVGKMPDFTAAQAVG